MTDVARKPPRPSVPAPAGNTATGALKLIALVFMFIDHSGKVLFDNMTEMRTLGRIAFPIYVWCMIVGFSRTRNVTRYLMRVLLVGLISQPLYLFALNSEGHIGVLIERTFQPLAGGYSAEGLKQVLYTVFLEKPNIFLTLLLGLIALCAVRDRDWLRKVWLPGVLVLAILVLSMSYNHRFDPILRKVSAPFSGMFPEDSLKEINRLLLRRPADYLAPARMLVSAFFGALYETLRIIFREPPNYFSLILMYAAALWGCSKKGRRPGQIWGPALMIILASMLGVDYGWKGVALFLMLYAVQGSRAGIAAVMISYMLFWGSFYNVTSELFGKKINLALLPDSISGPVRSLLRSETYSLAGLPLILIQFPQILTLPYWASWILCPSCPGYLSVPLDFRMPKWLGYLLYPGHLVLLIVLKVIQFGWFA